jgi:hypothetical protein
MQLAIAEAKRARDRGDYPIGTVITRVMGGREVVIASAGQPGENFGVKYQACGVGNAQIRIERVWPLPDRVRPLHYARTLRDVCRCMRLGENRCSRIRSLAERHRSLRSNARDGRIQVASVSHSLPTHLREGQSPYTGDWRFSARRMQDTIQLQGRIESLVC